MTKKKKIINKNKHVALIIKINNKILEYMKYN